jgi:hypothetical protein
MKVGGFYWSTSLDSSQRPGHHVEPGWCDPADDDAPDRGGGRHERFCSGNTGIYRPNNSAEAKEVKCDTGGWVGQRASLPAAQPVS